MKEITIKGRFFGDKTLPSLNNYLSEVGRNPKAGGRLKRQYVMIATNAIRRDAKRDRGNIFGLADKFIEDALRDCGTIPDDDPKHVLNFTHDFIYTDGEPYIRVEIEEVDMG